MRLKGIFVFLSMVLVLAIPQLALAVNPVHNIDCKTCHLQGYTFQDLGDGVTNVCLSCHSANPAADSAYASPLRGPISSDAGFVTGDASAHYGNNPSPVGQTSHNWAATSTNPAAGAVEPNPTLHPEFYGRYGTTAGRVACSRCHDPHGDKDTNPTLMPLKADNVTPATPNDMCTACHKQFADAMQSDHGLLSHPMIDDYNTFQAANAADYNAIPAYDPGNPYASGAQLVDGKVTCLTCHGLHFTDSDDATTDGPAQALNAGDGLMLRGNGTQIVDGGTGLPTGGTICTECHNYASGLHGSNGGAKVVGCLACHGGHNYNGGTPTYYMLNDSTGSYASRPTTAAERNAAWVGTEGVVDGFCETCHGDITNWTSSGSGADGGPVDRDHSFAADATSCDVCHATHAEGSFSDAAGCDDCHGWPPADSTGGGPAATGYAIANIPFGGFPATNYNYLSNNGSATYRDEATTGHSTHAAGGTDEYNYGCNQCHQGNTHNDPNGGANDNPTFQDVFIDDTGLLATTGSLTPGYTGGTNTCDTVYCHSDGVNPDRVIAGPNAQVIPNWVAGATDCTTCHNTGTTGTATVHNTHLALTLDGAAVTCGTCHDDTWEATDDLKNNGDGSIVDAHVDGDVDVAFNTTLTPTAPMDQVNGTCAVYCHSNGTAPVQVPDWDDAATGNCGDCHDADGVTGDSVAISSGSHSKHLSEGLTCTDCHTHDGSTFGGDHINGTKDVTAGVCNTCHGSTVAGIGVDAEPVWGNASSVTCNTCHQGALATIGGDTAPDATAINLTGNAHGVAGYDCDTCHDIVSADALHLDGTQGNTDRLSYASSDAACNDCHGNGAVTSTINGIDTHQAQTCATCHDPHYGGANLSLVRETSAPYSGTVVFTATTGADSYDEDDGAAGGAGEVNADDICATCHSVAGGTTHNNRDNSAITHNQGTDCFACHKAHTDDTAPFGMGAGTNCGDCHKYAPGTNQGALTSGAHATHITVVDGDILNEDVSDCAQCHGANVLGYNYAPGGTHMDGNFDFAAGLGYDDNGTRGNTADDPDTTCAGACHATAAGQAADWLGGVPLSCDSCHGGQAADTTTISTGSHTPHVNTATLSLDCDACHNGGVIPTDYSHISDQGTNEGEILYNSATPVADDALVDVPTEWIDGANTCSNVACHDPSGQDYKAEWGVDTASCTLCHGDDASMTTNEHGAHLGSGVTIDCTDCHIDNGTNDAHLSGTVEVTAGAKVSVWTDPTCTNSCHTLNGDSGAASWTAGNTLTCSDCHTVGKTGLYDAGATDQGPSSGLHAPSNALNHVTTADGFDGPGDGCKICHNATPTTSHINGVGPQDSLTATYNAWNASYIDSYANPAGCASSCHSDATANGGVGKWARKWIGVSDTAWGAANPGDPKCDNCHGDGMSNGTTLDGNWQAGVAPVHETDWDGDSTANEVLSPLSSHGTCQSCHGYNGAGYDKVYTNADGTTTVGHGDSYVTMNGPDVVRDANTGSTPLQGAQYNSVDFGCMAACHTGDYSAGSGDPNEDHVMADSAWPVNYGDFGSGDCDTCHASFGADHTDTNESAAMHSSHSGSNYITSCNNCHPHDGLSVSPGTGVHNDGWVDFNGTTLSTTGNRYSRDAGNYDDTCTNNCHDVDNSTGEWAAQSLGGDSCTDCHAATGKLLDQGGYLPTSGAHSEHIAADADYVDDCASCHGASANTGGHTGHKQNDGIDLGGDLLTYSSVNDNCTNNCHTGDTDINEWGSGALDCTDCHSSTLSLDAGGDGTFSTANGPPTGKHDEHMGNSTFVADCANCHTHNGPLDAGASGHVDGATVTTITLNTAVITDYSGAPSCTNVCHDVDNAADDGWVNDARTLECNDCHSTALILDGGGENDISTSVGPNAGRHDEHMASAYSYACNSCHGHDGELTDGTHANGGSITVAGQITVAPIPADDTCTNNCHNVTDGADWTAGAPVNGIVLACNECHGSTKSLDQGPIAPTSRDHTPHLTSNALPGTEANGEDCYVCHDASITNVGAVKNYRLDTGNNDHLDTLTTSVTFNSGFGYEGAAAGISGNGDAATCSNILCHNGVTTPTWAAATGISCGECHNTSGTGPLPSGSTARSHSAHANNDAVYTDCALCHINATSYTATGGDANHQNLIVNVNPFDGAVNGGTYTDADGAAGVNYSGDFTDDGTCANSCHGAAPSPFWGNTGSVSCTTCHNDGTDDGNILNAVPSATGGIHDSHTAANDAYVTSDCVACHGADSNALAYSANANHIDGVLGNGVATYANKLTSYNNGDGTCANNCHSVVSGRDWTPAGSLACDDCHGAIGKDLYRDRTSGSHAAHYNTASQPVFADYGRTGNVEVADYDFGCGECHPASEAADHLDASVREVANQASSYTGGPAGTCSTNACHENGLGAAPATTPTWGTPFAGESCDDCHGNYPATNAHQVHAVGIHFGELYNMTDGGLLTTDTADSSINEVDHGDGTATTISCNVCHNDTVTTGRNRLGSECASCHSTDPDIAANNIAIADHTVHVDGTTDVAFLGTIKSKAQLRDNLADADANGGTNLLSEIWNRLTGYKSAANSADTGLITADAYELSGANTCSNIACHNGNDAVWAAPANDCMACHKSVPK